MLCPFMPLRPPSASPYTPPPSSPPRPRLRPRPNNLPPSPEPNPRPSPILTIPTQVAILINIPALAWARTCRSIHLLSLARCGCGFRGFLRFLPLLLALAVELHFAVEEGGGEFWGEGGGFCGGWFGGGGGG